jgi:hypothetical protein
MAYKRKILKNETAETYCNDFRNILTKSTSIDDAFDKVEIYQHNRNIAFTKAMEHEQSEDTKVKLIMAGVALGGFALAVTGYLVYTNV